jgi:hypothetical protein
MLRRLALFFFRDGFGAFISLRICPLLIQFPTAPERTFLRRTVGMISTNTYSSATEF